MSSGTAKTIELNPSERTAKLMELERLIEQLRDQIRINNERLLELQPKQQKPKRHFLFKTMKHY